MLRPPTEKEVGAMEFLFTDEQKMIEETAQAFFRENATSKRTRAAMTGDGVDRDLWNAFCTELGFSGIAVSEDNGGSGLGMVEFAIIAEAAGATVAAIPLLTLATAVRAIEFGGNNEQRNEWLPLLLSGEKIAASGESSELEVSGDALSGIVNHVPYGGSADIFVFHKDDAAWIVPANTPGLRIEALTTLDQTRPFATVTLDGARGVSLDNGAAAAAASNTGGWLCLAAEALGGAQTCLERTCEYARDRVQFGRQIGSFQAYKHRLADMMISVEQARSAVYWAACAVDEGAADAQTSLRAAKSYCTDTFFQCAGDMIQLHGGIGFTWEHDAHLFFKRAKASQELLGSNHLHREYIATEILGEAS
ncbi:MAG: acyl-CoA dehydrogenase family protein [Pseudomonadota bacterium]